MYAYMLSDRETEIWREKEKQRFGGKQGRTMLSKCNMAQLPAGVVKHRVCGPDISTRSLTHPVMNMCSSTGLPGVWHMRLAPARHHAKVSRRWDMTSPAPLTPD